MGAEQLQGTPWHPEQMHRTCKDGSKHCLYNRNGKCAFVVSNFYKQDCVGKGVCDNFETKAGTPKISHDKTIIIKQNPHNSKQPTKEMFSRPPIITKHYTEHVNKDKIEKKDLNTMKNEDQNNKNDKLPVQNDKHIKFIENAESRVNDIIVKIEKLENLSDKNRYEYTNEEIEKMFNSIEDAVKTAKQSFINKNRTRFKF